MFCLSDSDRFFLYPYPTDMRKSFYSLSGIVTEKMGKDVQEGTVKKVCSKLPAYQVFFVSLQYKKNTENGRRSEFKYGT